MGWKKLGWKRWWKQSLKTLKFQRKHFNWQSRGHGFEPRMLHQKTAAKSMISAVFFYFCRTFVARSVFVAVPNPSPEKVFPQAISVSFLFSRSLSRHAASMR